MNLITEIQYFGSINYYYSLINASIIHFAPQLPFRKERHLNRTMLYGPNGMLQLSLPLEGGRNKKQLTGNVILSEEGNWRRTHWRSIHDAYRKSPWFDAWGWELEALLMRPEKNMVSLNLSTLKWVLAKLKWKVDILSVEALDEEMLRMASRAVKWSEPVTEIPAGYPQYPQVFMDRMGFIGNLSILDLLMNEGPAAGQYLHRLKDYMNGQQNVS